MQWQWKNVTMEDYQSVIDSIAEQNENKNQLVLNLCDGDEVNGTAGVSVIHYLEEKDLLYTGSDAFFYQITTSKIPMKQAFEQNQIATPAWKILNEIEN